MKPTIRCTFRPLLCLLVLSACGSLLDDKKSDEDKDPVNRGSEVFIHEDQGDGSTLTLVDARSEDSWYFLDLDTREEVPAEEAGDSTSWDLAFQRYRVRTNSGTSGPGAAEAAVVDGAFEEVKTAPSEGWLVDDENSPGVDNDPAYAFHAGEGWYRYDISTHRLDPRGRIYVLRSSEGKLYKIEMLSYYDDAGTPGFLSFRWAELSEAELPEPLPGSCRSKVSGGDEQAFELCSLKEGRVQHIRVEGMKAGSGHSWSQLLLGFEDTPASAQGKVQPGEFRLMLYAFTPHTVHLAFGELSLTATTKSNLATGPVTLCFDIRDGDEHPELSLWIHGEKGADCSVFETLNQKSALELEGEWDGEVGTFSPESKALFWQAKGLGSSPVVTLFERGASSCESVWTESSDWQELCEPMGGASRFRVEDILAEQGSRYVYLVLGEQPEPEGAPASEEGDGKAIVTAGLSHSSQSWTWFRMGGESSSQMVFEDDLGKALYSEKPSTICVELFQREEGSGLWMWATGSNGADCADHSSLNADTRLHEELWEQPLAEGLRNFIKTSNSGIGFGRVVVTNDRVDDELP